MKAKLGLMESRFADIVWQNQPVTTTQLVQLCAAELNWARTTTYTVLKRLCERGIFNTEKSVVTANVTKSEFHAIQSENFVNQTFQGSLPAFIAAFSSRRALTAEEIAELKTLIESMEA